LRASRTTTDVSWGQVVRFTANGRALVSTKQARGSFRLQRKTRDRPGRAERPPPRPDHRRPLNLNVQDV